MPDSESPAAGTGKASPRPNRIVHHAEAIDWLRNNELTRGQHIVTSLPDICEIPDMDFPTWRAWFIDAAALICERVHGHSVVVFYQTDIKRDGRWIDKSFLVQQGAERAGSHLLWHKVVCRTTPGCATFGRPAYAHLLCLSRAHTTTAAQSTADVLPSLGNMTWSRAMGTKACDAAVKFLIDHTNCDTIVDPFCGVGTMLAAANHHGLDAIGVELSARRVRKAKKLQYETATKPRSEQANKR